MILTESITKTKTKKRPRSLFRVLTLREENNNVLQSQELKEVYLNKKYNMDKMALQKEKIKQKDIENNMHLYGILRGEKYSEVEHTIKEYNKIKNNKNYNYPINQSKNEENETKNSIDENNEIEPNEQKYTINENENTKKSSEIYNEKDKEEDEIYDIDDEKNELKFNIIKNNEEQNYINTEEKKNSKDDEKKNKKENNTMDIKQLTKEKEKMIN